MLRLLKHQIWLFAMGLLSISLHASDPIVVGLFYGSHHVRATIQVQKGSYDFLADGVSLFKLETKESLDITASGSKLNVFYKGQNYTGIQKVRMVELTSSEFSIVPAGHKPNNRLYKQNLRAISYSGRLQLNNELDLEDYVSGVIEAESGGGQELEYYKVQATISRTYALNNLRRHSGESFNVCDATHCQVYHGKPRHEAKAQQAAMATRDLVIVDHEIELITAAFHSNCGGHTVNAEAVWSKPVSYLAARPDTFCLGMPHSQWQKSLHVNKWSNYIEGRKNASREMALASTSETPARLQTHFYIDSTLAYPLKSMREELQLRSTYFQISHMGEQVILDGRGFGHGVGLCQEGAMRMASLGYSYSDIIHFYYKDVHIIPRYMTWFFKD